MTYRTLTALLFAIIVAVEVYFFVTATTPMTTDTQESTTYVGTGFISRYNNPKTVKNVIDVIDYKQQANINMKFGLIIGSTILIAGITTFSIPNKPIAKQEESPSA